MIADHTNKGLRLSPEGFHGLEPVQAEGIIYGHKFYFRHRGVLSSLTLTTSNGTTITTATNTGGGFDKLLNEYPIDLLNRVSEAGADATITGEEFLFLTYPHEVVVADGYLRPRSLEELSQHADAGNVKRNTDGTFPFHQILFYPGGGYIRIPTTTAG